LTINDYEDKKSKAGKRYYRFETNKGWFSAFDKDLAQKLKDSEGKRISVSGDVEESIIREFHGAAETTADSDDEMFDEKPKKKSGGSFGGKDQDSIVAQNLCTSTTALAKTILEDSKEITTERAEEMMKDCSKLVLKTYRNLYAELKNTD
jgi:hypothetical protein